METSQHSVCNECSEVQWDTKNILSINIQAQVCKQGLDLSTTLQFAAN
jgi:hypothetical protein